MRRAKPREEVTLLDVLVDGFEKNESIGGFHWRSLPLQDEAQAVRKLTELGEEARRWKGPPSREDLTGPRRILAWPDLEIRQIGRGVMVCARAPAFDAWWHEAATWEGDPIGPVLAWLREDRRPRQ